MIPLTSKDLPLVIELVADATGVGKSFAAWRIRHHLDQARIPNVLVRIETRGVRAALRDGDVYIPIEDFAGAYDKPGGIAGVLQPLSATIVAAERTRRVIIVDWAGGSARHHIEFLAKTRLDATLAALGITGLSIVVTTNRTEQMREAAANLQQLATVAPAMHRGLLLNKRYGKFSFIGGSQPALEHRKLMRAARGCAVIKFPAVVGQSWKIAEDAQMTMPEVIAATTKAFASRTGLDVLTAGACITEVAAFWQLSQGELSRVLRFPGAAE
ncbi:MAG: hypothetical protein KIT76_09360 [Pseudolabrys sp.]|nr:hypothetical protein [Pseudolabrys sp.]